MGGIVTLIIKRSWTHIILSIVLSLCLIAIPFIRYFKSQAVVSELVISFIIAILIACGFTFTLANSDIVPILRDMIEDFYVAMSYNDVTDWLGPNWEDGLGVYNSYLGMNPGLFELGKQFVTWAQNNNKIPNGGSVSNPEVKVIKPGSYIPYHLSSTYYNGTNAPVYPVNLIAVQQLSGGVGSGTGMYEVALTSGDALFQMPIATFISLVGTGYTFTFNNGSQSVTFPFGSVPANYSWQRYFCGSNYGSGFSYTTSGDFSLFYPKSGTPIYFAFVTTETMGSFSSYARAYLIAYYQDVLNRYVSYALYPNAISDGWYNAGRINIFLSTSRSNESSIITSTGIPQYSFNNNDRIYIDLQQGDLNSVLTALTNLITQVNQNLVQATIALQEISASNLPVDTTPFIQLVESYENVTNDCISGTISVTSALSSMYTLLSASISSITNASLENACISAYNAFVNKLALFQSNSGGSSQSIGDYENVQDFQSDLEDLTDSFNSGQSTISQILTSAATLLDTYMSNASGMQEVIGLQNAYNLFLNDLGFELNLSSNAQSVISDFNDTLDDYLDGTISREEAISSLRTDYRNGISGSMTASDVGAITIAFQSALDQITVNELSISESIGEVSADTIALEGDLLEMLDFTQLSAYFNFESWEFFPDTESNLYREYFQRFLSTTSPFYDFLYYPLILGVAGLILGTTIRFGVKARRSRGSSSKPGGDD